ncbi:MAG: FeoC-like transcriptional regulator [Roseiflexus sp.]|nr:FeoC-like transcriptional regulator [Roseiflexus sp.]MCS7290360.1 FeoC-like transcriptional regulator [Roseiflexus sp.]MDW8144970.1 FeoC-like transcriptional regulator [Roseiflexaceae bacterium]MDW8233941.1 FeoC-like transcriptional regulator [Roseiflexaceae bacterium]
MLYQVLEVIEQANGSVSLAELSQQLQIEPGALEGMIAFWVRKGRLKEATIAGCGGGSRGCICGAYPNGCIFSAAGPRVITLASPDP